MLLQYYKIGTCESVFTGIWSINKKATGLNLAVDTYFLTRHFVHIVLVHPDENGICNGLMSHPGGVIDSCLLISTPENGFKFHPLLIKVHSMVNYYFYQFSYDFT